MENDLTQNEIEYLLYYIECYYGDNYVISMEESHIIVSEFKNRPHDSELGAGG